MMIYGHDVSDGLKTEISLNCIGSNIHNIYFNV